MSKEETGEKVISTEEKVGKPKEETGEKVISTEEKVRKPKEEREENVVYIGRKPVMSYVMAVITHFSISNAKTVILKARGRSITTAVDTAEITRRRFMDKLKVTKIAIDTENMLEQETQRKRAVSTIEITLSIA